MPGLDRRRFLELSGKVTFGGVLSAVLLRGPEQALAGLLYPHPDYQALDGACVLPRTEEERVVALRKEYGWGAKKLHKLLACEGIILGTRTINRIINRNELVHPKDSHPPAVKRFERALPNQMWQMGLPISR